MRRRTVLGALGAGLGLPGLAGCTEREPPSTGVSPTATAPRTPTGDAATPTTGMGGQPTSTPGRSPTPTERPTPTATERPTPEPARSPSPTAAPFELVSIDAPAGAEIGESIRYRFTVENTGDDARAFETTISTRTEATDWTVLTTWTPGRLAPGERRTFESEPFAREYLSAVTIRIDAFDETFSIAFDDRRLAFSEAYLDPRRREIAVGGFAIRRSYTYTNDRGEERRAEAPEGRQWVFASVSVRNRSQQPVESPGPGSFSLLAGDETYGRVGVRADNRYESTRLPRGERTGGVVAFETPDTFGRADYRIRWHESFENGEVGVVWGA